MLTVNNWNPNLVTIYHVMVNCYCVWIQIVILQHKCGHLVKKNQNTFQSHFIALRRIQPWSEDSAPVLIVWTCCINKSQYSRNSDFFDFIALAVVIMKVYNINHLEERNIPAIKFILPGCKVGCNKVFIRKDLMGSWIMSKNRPYLVR